MQLSVAEMIMQVIEAFGTGGQGLRTDQHVALLGLLTLAVTFAQNALEDRSVVPAVLKHAKARPTTSTPGDGREVPDMVAGSDGVTA